MSGRLWSVAETAEYLGIAPGTLRNMVSAGRAPRSHKVGSRRKFRQADVDRWLDEHASDSPAPRRRRRAPRRA